LYAPLLRKEVPQNPKMKAKSSYHACHKRGRGIYERILKPYKDEISFLSLL